MTHRCYICHGAGQFPLKNSRGDIMVRCTCQSKLAQTIREKRDAAEIVRNHDAETNR